MPAWMPPSVIAFLYIHSHSSGVHEKQSGPMVFRLPPTLGRADAAAGNGRLKLILTKNEVSAAALVAHFLFGGL